MFAGQSSMYGGVFTFVSQASIFEIVDNEKFAKMAKMAVKDIGHVFPYSRRCQNGPFDHFNLSK